jgi:hypothetical protein
MGTAKIAPQGVSPVPGRPYLRRRDGDRAPAARLEANVGLGLLIAQVNHGPGGGFAVAHLVLVAVVIVGGTIYLVLRARTGSHGDRDRARVTDDDHRSDRGTEA